MLNQGEMHLCHPFTTAPSLRREKNALETEIYPLARRTYGKIGPLLIRAEKHLSHLAEFLFPSLSSWFYHKAGHFFGGDVAKGRILWYTSSNISVNRERASFSIRAIEFYRNEYRMDCIVYSRCQFNRRFAKTPNGYLNLFYFYWWCHFWQLFFFFFSAISISAICLKLAFKYCLLCFLCGIVDNEKLYDSHI